MPNNCAIAQNIINFPNDVKRKIFDDFNTFNHKELPTTDPIKQRDVLIWVMDNTPHLTALESYMLLKIVRETVCRGFYYTFISQQEIMDDLGCSRKSVYNALQKLIKENWIAIKPSEKYTGRNCIDFNVDMVLGGKYTNGKKLPVRKQGMGKNYPPEEDSNTSSKEEVYTDENFVRERREKLEKSAVGKSKRKRSAASLMRTWVQKLNSSNFPSDSCPSYLLKHILNLDYNTAELHQFLIWVISSWDWLRYRNPKTPITPSLRWVIACRNEYLTLWAQNDNSAAISDNVRDLAEARRLRDKWKDIDFTD